MAAFCNFRRVLTASKYAWSVSVFSLILLYGNRAMAGVLIADDFEAGKASVASYARQGATAAETIAVDGTIDSYMGKPGHCVALQVKLPGGDSKAVAGVTIGAAVSASGIADLKMLTIAADVWMDELAPVMLRIASTDADGRTTGTLACTAISPVSKSWYRYEFDLSSLKTESGHFNPLAPHFNISFELSNTSEASQNILRIDNLSLSSPGIYVSGKGNDSADGHSESTAFATIQHAVDAAVPGDVVMIMDGEYRNKTPSGLVHVEKTGLPAKWVTVRSYPGQTPRLINNGWEIFKIDPGTAYFEIRGLELEGYRQSVKLADALADGVLKEKNGAAYGGDPLYNGNGISAEGRHASKPALCPHHLRFIGNHVYDNCGGGIAGIASDYITIEGNNVHDNAHYMRYGGSGISFLVPNNFDNTTSTHFFIINNYVRNNRGYVPWISVGKMSDGNGIIVDVNMQGANHSASFTGRTLVANNLCISNGGGGITVTTASHVDIVNNTLYHNVQTTDLAKRGWGDLMLGGPPPNCQDVRIYNNIICADAGRPIITAGRINDWTCKNNIYFGDPGAKTKAGDDGDSDNLVANPQFKNPSLTGSTGDFTLLPQSPAIGHGLKGVAGSPLVDLLGNPRPSTGNVTAGALEYPGK